MTNWPRWVDISKDGAKPYPGWPITIDDSQNGQNGAQFELMLPAKIEGVVEVFAAGSAAPVLSWRLPAATDRIRVWAEAEYTVKAGKKSYAKLMAQRRA